jgi:hypothetical protein
MANDTPQDMMKAFWAGLKPDPLPEPPEGLSEHDTATWRIGARAGVMLGRRLAALEIEQGQSIRIAGGLWERPEDE